MYKKTLCFVLLSGIASVANAQRYMGVATGNYNAINSLYLNPANITGDNEKIVVNIGSGNVAVDNSLGTFTNLGNLGNSNENAFTVTGNKPFNMLIPSLELRLPGIMVSLKDKHKQSFALSTRIRAMNQFNNFDPSFYNTVTSSNNTANESYRLQSSNFNWTAHVWSEVGLTYALQVFESGPHQLKAGVTVRYLGGIDYLSLKGKYLDASYTAGSDTLFANHSDLEFSSNAISSNDVKSNGLKSSDVLGSMFGSKTGSGIGMDIGVVYTYNINATDQFGAIDDPDDFGHKITISVSVIDVGAINYKEKDNFFVNVTGNGYLTGNGLSDHLQNFTEFRNYVVTQGFTADTGSKATKLSMPTSMVLGADYKAYRRIFINATYIANLANRQNYGNSFFNQLTLTPRYENRLVTVAMPVTFSSMAHDVKLGLGFRIAGFFFDRRRLEAFAISTLFPVVARP